MLHNTFILMGMPFFQTKCHSYFVPNGGSLLRWKFITVEVKFIVDGLERCEVLGIIPGT